MVRKLAELPRSNDDFQRIRLSLNGAAGPAANRQLLLRGLAVKLSDGRVVVTIPARDEYYSRLRASITKAGRRDD